MPNPNDLQHLLDALAAKHGVPGAAAGVSVGDDVAVVATGVARLGTSVPLTPESVFLIASITKVWTATLVMQLVDEGRVDLTAPVNEYLRPELELADPEVAETVTVAQLLSHTGGFFGDAPEPNYRDDDAVERLVRGYVTLPQLHRPGTLFSYSNSGYNVLGRLVECVTGTTWDDALRQRIVEPLGLRSTTTLPEETMTRPLAVGHVMSEPGSARLVPVPRWLDPRGSGPCGGTLATTPGELLQFARMHLRDGLADSGHRLLQPETARAMREPRVAQPDPSLSPAWGLGWAVEHVGRRAVGHIGSTAGQQSRLFLAPDRDVAICVLATGDLQGMVDEFVSTMADEMADVVTASPPTPVQHGVDPVPFVGRYRMSEEATIDVTDGPSGLQASFTTSGAWAAFHGDFTTPLKYTGGTTFLMTMPPLTKPVAATFVREDDTPGPSTHIATQMRVAPRVAPVDAEAGA
jgi:CubicO group peptidase (beta-lactamase class C family)